MIGPARNYLDAGRKHVLAGDLRGTLDGDLRGAVESLGNVLRLLESSRRLVGTVAPLPRTEDLRKRTEKSYCPRTSDVVGEKSEMAADLLDVVVIASFDYWNCCEYASNHCY